MPIEYKYDADTRIVHTRISGTVSAADMLGCVRSVLGDDGIGEGFIESVDSGEVTDLVVAYSQLRPFPAMWKEYMSKGCAGVLIYAPSDVSFGIFRMLRTVISLQHPEAEELFVIVRSREEVLEKLREIREVPRP